ncbi:MAG: propane monooxygenase reductase component, partial [Mycobacterium sp.]|nr:propane monooxygenase reductase component [Mycobacterium sp.]
MTDSHKINFEPVDIEIDVGEDENILDAAFRQGIHLMHGCREGRCSACKSYVLDGDIQMENYSTFACNDAEVDDGFVLLCRSHAFSDCTIELLNFDEDELLGGIPIQDVRTEVLAVEPKTRDIVSLRLKPIEPGKFDFKPGQYADLHIPGTEEHRSFSM